MKRHLITILALVCASFSYAQSASDYLKARNIPAKTIFYNYSDQGTLMPKINWGLDLAWISETNMLQGRNYLNLGKENVDIVRLSFQPCWSYTSTLGDSAKVYLDKRLAILNKLGTTPNIYLNSDPMGLDGADATVSTDYIYTSWGTKKCNTSNWVNMMKQAGQYVEQNGYTVTSVAPFNEPDYSGWGQGTSSHMNSICQAAKSDSWFSGKRLMTGNTLNADYAATWYNACSSYSDEANTHMLAGTWSNYTSFLNSWGSSSSVQLCQDEMHNVMEAMVGANYGMDNGIWWGTAEHARAQFCRANDGTGYRLGYVENSGALMAASVYRNTQDGTTEAYVGAAERTAYESSFGFVSKDRDVYYNGEGPTRAFYVHMPADPSGTYESSLQRNAEAVINIQSGADVQPSSVIGDWQMMNVGTGKVITGNASWTGWSANKVTLADGTGADGQGWSIEAVQDTIGGDFSYYTIHQNNGQWWKYYLDDNEWSFNEANEMIVYPGGGTGCEQWWFEYAGDGSYYIHNRYTNLVLDAENGSTVEQKTLIKGTDTQKWKLCATGITVDQTAPATPTGLAITPMLAALKLSWTSVADADVAGYTILRAEKRSSDFNTIARAVSGTSYIDNTAVQGKTYTYKIKAIDKCANSSAASVTIEGSTLTQNGLVARYEFDGSSRDKSTNKMDAATLGATYTDSNKSGSKAITLDGSSAYVQLPYQIANSKAMTFTGWVYWNGGDSWQRIFDLGNGEDEYMFLSPSNGSAMRYEVKHNGTTEGITLSSKLTSGSWQHVAVTVESGKTCIYVNGTLSGSSTSLTILPSDIQSVCNYLGRSQFQSDALLNANLDDVRFYNYALSASEVTAVMNEAAVTDTPAEWASGSSYYAYNVEAGQFLCAGNSWGTQASLSTTGISWTINDGSSAGLYKLTRSTDGSTYLGITGAADMYVDRPAGEADLQMTQDANTGYTTISINPANSTYGTSAYGTTYVGWNANTSLTTVMPLLNQNDGTAAGVQWLFMETATYNKYQSTIASALTARQALLPYYQAALRSDADITERTLYENPAATSTQLTSAASTFASSMETYAQQHASTDNPVDLSFLLADGDLNDTSNSGWTADGDWSSNTTFQHSTTAMMTNRFVESWVNGWGGNTLADRSLTQSLSNLPAGRYVLQVDATSTNQSTRADITGVNLVFGSKSVALSNSTDAPLCFQTPTLFVRDNQTITAGLTVSSTNASWLAFDNFRLLYLGKPTIGDITKDGRISLQDLVALVKILQNPSADNSQYDLDAADVDEDGSITTADVTPLVNKLLE